VDEDRVLVGSSPCQFGGQQQAFAGECCALIRAKRNADQRRAGNDEAVNKMAVMGALNLYMDFINLFIMLLRFFGERKN